MSLKITINSVIVGGNVVWPATTLDDGSALASAYLLGGGFMWPADDPAVSAQALIATTARKKGQNVEYVQSLMLAAVSSSEGAVSANYGTGVDGAFVYDGTTTILGMAPSSQVYTLTRDIFATSLTVNAGVTIKAAGFKIYVAGTLLNNGTIHNGGNASALGVAGAATNTGSYGVQGKAGGAGGVNAVGAAGTNGTAAPNGAGAGGAGGAGSTNAGGAGGTAAASAATVGGVTTLAAILQGASLGASPTAFAGGGGGGGGGGIDASAVGGGGGGSGGCMLVAAYRLINNGSIHANGGAGAAGSGSTASGGGAGGGGGYAAILTHSKSGTGTITAAGGAGGAGVVAGIAGAAGAVGTIVQATM